MISTPTPPPDPIHSRQAEETQAFDPQINTAQVVEESTSQPLSITLSAGALDINNVNSAKVGTIVIGSRKRPIPTSHSFSGRAIGGSTHLDAQQAIEGVKNAGPDSSSQQAKAANGSHTYTWFQKIKNALSSKISKTVKGAIEGEWTLVGAGKAKHVWIKSNSNSKAAMYTPTSNSKVAEIQEEVKTAKAIQKELYKESFSALILHSPNLIKQLEELKKTEKLKESEQLEELKKLKQDPETSKVNVYQRLTENFINFLEENNCYNPADVPDLVKKYKDKNFNEIAKLGCNEQIGNEVLKLFDPENAYKDSQLTREPMTESDKGELQKALNTFINTGSQIALNMKEIKDPQFQIRGKYTVETDKASGDLDGNVQKLKHPQSIQIGTKLLSGLKDLHRADYVHGDLKLENVLIYEEDGKIVDIKLSDFGKARQYKGVQIPHVGNNRFMAPEGQSTFQAEVYSAGIMLIRLLEEELLASSEYNKTKMLVDISPANEATIGMALPKRRGIEKFLVNHKAFPNVESTLLGRVKTGRNYASVYLRGARRPEELQDAQVAIDNYVNTLINNMILKYPANKQEYEKLGELLHQMTRMDPLKRPTMTEAFEKWRSIEAELLKKSKV